MGSLTKHGLCFGEDEEHSPWPPLHVTRGFDPQDSTVTVATVQDPEMVCNRYGTTAESVMDAVAEELVSEVVPKALTSFVQNDIGCQQRL